MKQLETDIYNGAAKWLETQGWTLNALFDAMMEEKVNIREATRVNRYKYWSWYIRGSIGNILAEDISRGEMRSLGFCLFKNIITFLGKLILLSNKWDKDDGRMSCNS